MKYRIGHMSRKNLDTAIEWAAKEGWNPGLYDADAFYATDPQGFFMGFLGDEPVASLSAVSYGPDFGFLGFLYRQARASGERVRLGHLARGDEIFKRSERWA